MKSFVCIKYLMRKLELVILIEYIQMDNYIVKYTLNKKDI